MIDRLRQASSLLKRILLIFLLLCAQNTLQAYGADIPKGEDSHGLQFGEASALNELRRKNRVRIAIPNKLAEQFWNDLSSAAFVETSLSDNSQEKYFYVSSYYDTAKLDLLAQGITLHLHNDRLKENNKEVESIFEFQGDIEPGPQNAFIVKRYNKVIMASDKHAILGRIKRSERDQFLYTLEQRGVSQLDHLRELFSVNIYSRTVDSKEGEYSDLKIKFVEYVTEKYDVEQSELYEIELVLTPKSDQKGVAGKGLTEKALDEMVQVSDPNLERAEKFISALYQHYPQIIHEPTPLGEKLFGSLQGNIILSEAIIKYPIIIELIQVILLVFIAAIIILVFFWKRLLTNKQGISLTARSYLIAIEAENGGEQNHANSLFNQRS